MKPGAGAEQYPAKKTPAPGRQRRPIFVINLKRDFKRLASMKQQLEDRGLSYEVIEAIDGQLIPEQEIEKINARSLGRIRAPEAGCYRSHMKAFQTMVERQLPEAIILEDDIRLHEDFAAVTHGCELPEKCRVLHLGGNINYVLQKGELYDSCSRFHERPLPKGYKMSCRIDTMYGAYAYIMSLPYARRLLQEEKRMIVSADHLLFDWHYNLYLPWMVYKKVGDANYRMLAEHIHAEISDNRPDNVTRRERQNTREIEQALLKKGKKLPRRNSKERLPVFIINREGDTRELDMIKQPLDAGKIPFEIIAAVDEEQASRHISTSSKAFDPALPIREISRYLSHLKAYRSALETGAPEAIILEDNILLDEDFPAWFHGDHLQEEYRMPSMDLDRSVHRGRLPPVFFSPYKAKPLRNFYQGQTKLVNFKALDDWVGGAYVRAYIIRRSQMRRILQRKDTIRVPLTRTLFQYKRSIRTRLLEIMKERVAWFRNMMLHRYPELLNLDEKSRVHTRRFLLLQYLKINLSLYSFSKLFIPGRATSRGNRGGGH